MGNPVGWFEIYVADMNRARKFYEGVFGVTLEKSDAGPELEMYTFPHAFGSYGSGGALVKMGGLTPSGISTVVYFSCDDRAVQEKKSLASGGKLHKTKFSIGKFGFISLVTDTEGNMIGLHSNK
jgi:predicted enzyme related to lactoylglutathione lyase